ncbi:hypothetical protein [Methanococcoides sp. NM1]|uniref:hypothetical protein n=1 Tax=Methanococcoides sp. NM1 TaxID=1201013 RepID=UPI001083C204|nr:hypothetical protein [Methanococcoides sp. NM1]
MTEGNEVQFKEHDKLEVFFNSEHIKLQNSLEFFKEKNVFVFAYTNNHLADFAKNFFLGIESQETLRKYIDINAYPKMSGFILLTSEDISLNDLKEYLSSHSEDSFSFKKSTLLSINTDNEWIYGKIEYSVTEFASHNLFSTERKMVSFRISKNENHFNLKIKLNRDSDYSVVHKVIDSIIEKDSSINIKIVDLNLSFLTTHKKHKFISEFIDEIDQTYDSVGIIRYGSNQANDLETDVPFDQFHLKSNNETNIIPIGQLTQTLEERAAALNSVHVIVYNKNDNFLFIIGLHSNEKKKRIEIGLKRDFKKVENHDQITAIKSKSDLDEFNSANIDDVEKETIFVNFWDSTSKRYLECWKEQMESLNRKSFV